MRRRNFILPAIALAGLILFFCFLVHLLLLRYERGDVYPEYSTLRADPLGTRAYYEALDSLSGYPVARGFKSLHREMEAKPDALFYLGFNVDDLATFTKEDVAELDTFVKNGGRVVITFATEEPKARDEDDPWKKISDKTKKAEPPKKDEAKPAATPPAKADAAPEKETEPPAEPKTEQEKYEREEYKREQEEEAKEDPRHHDGPVIKYQRSLGAVWGFGWDVHTEDKKKPKDTSYNAMSKPDEEKPEVFAEHLYEGNVEATVPWKSALYFKRLEPQWQRIYSAKHEPVFIRRTLGKGEIVLATDSYFISNEALRNDRRPQLLGLITGAPGRLLFDETHLGTEEKEGVMYLAEKFRLEGYLYGILGVVLLFLWRNSLPLVPPRLMGRNAALGGAVSGKDSRSGLVNLLRRNIAPVDLLKTSFGEWRRNNTAGRSHIDEKATAMQSVLSVSEGAKAETIVESYHLLREINTPSRAKNYATKS